MLSQRRRERHGDRIRTERSPIGGALGAIRHPIARLVFSGIAAGALGSNGKTYVPGEKGPLFVMTRLAPKTPNTDGGWVYATLSPQGDAVTSAGRLPSCMGCHEKDTQDRLFRPLPREKPSGG